MGTNNEAMSWLLFMQSFRSIKTAPHPLKMHSSTTSSFLLLRLGWLRRMKHKVRHVAEQIGKQVLIEAIE
jgi:hypothetical protein